MDTTRSSAKSTIEKLVHFFEQNIHQFKSSSFNETQARQQLIDPFFEALGWDITNRGMKPLYLQEVIPEGRVKTNIGKEVREQTVMLTRSKLSAKNTKNMLQFSITSLKMNTKRALKKRLKNPTTVFGSKARQNFLWRLRNHLSIFRKIRMQSFR